MLNIFLFLSVVFFATLIVGKIIEKAKIPWIFAALLVGTALAVYNPFSDITNTDTFTFLSTLGMYFLLFMIGFEVDLKEIRKRSEFMVKATLFVISLEAFFGTMLIHFVFGYSWLISLIVSMSFATVGEAVLIPILDKFNVVNTKLGQSIIGIGTLDDIVEILLLIFVGFLIGVNTGTNLQYTHVLIVIISLFVLFVMTAGFIVMRKRGKQFFVHNVETLFLVLIAVLFLFLGIGSFAESAPLAALLSGVAIKTFIPKKRLELVEKEIKAISYGFFAPLFFLSAGLFLDVRYLFSSPLLILLVVVVSSGAKILGSYLISNNELGAKESILLGIGLSVRFSTSIIILKLFLDNGFIENSLYSIIIASSIAFNFVIPFVFSRLLVRWKVVKK